MNKNTNMMSQMLPVATPCERYKINLNSIEKTHIYMCSFCGAANHVPLELFEKWSPGCGIPLY